MKLLNEILGTKYPIIQGGMANIATGEFAAACSNAGALGLIGAGGMKDVDTLRAHIRRCKELTDKPFGVNIMLMHPQADEFAQLCGGRRRARRHHRRGQPRQVRAHVERRRHQGHPRGGSCGAGKASGQGLGVDAVIAEGTESGGHVGEMTTMALVPQVVDAVSVPVIAAGGMADGRQLAAAFALGACGVQVGTCLLVSEECPVHANYKAALLRAKDSDTIVTGRIGGTPVRVLKNRMSREYVRQEKAGADKMELEKYTLGSLRRAVFEGDTATGSLMAGQVAGMLHEIRPVAAILDELWADGVPAHESAGRIMLTLAGRALAVPILQGGMGVGVSLGGLAGAVAACGGMGCISTADTGYREPDFEKDPVSANRRALAEEIKKAKEIAGGAGIVAINAMVATQNYADAVKTAVEAGVDAIVSGAGLPLELPGLVGKADVALAPIVSSGRAAKLILRRWAKAFGRTADFVVIEGCKAGGHLGFAEEDLLAGKCQTLDEILPEVLAEVKPFEEQFGRAIPVFVAGGVYTGEDMAHYMKQGAAGVQIATRFIPTYECDASQAYKDVLLNASAEDVRIIHSPVGMPGRALNTPLVQKLSEGMRFPPKRCARCLKGCNPAQVPYCITHALIEAVKGNVEEGLFFCGANVGRLDKMRSVRALMDELMNEWRNHQ